MRQGRSGFWAYSPAPGSVRPLCIALLLIDNRSTQKARAMSVDILASGRPFPATHVDNMFARNQIVFERREISKSDA